MIYSGASILGNSEIGENVVIGAGSLIVDEIIPSNSKVKAKSKLDYKVPRGEYQRGVFL